LIFFVVTLTRRVPNRLPGGFREKNHQLGEMRLDRITYPNDDFDHKNRLGTGALLFFLTQELIVPFHFPTDIKNPCAALNPASFTIWHTIIAIQLDGNHIHTPMLSPQAIERAAR